MVKTMVPRTPQADTGDEEEEKGKGPAAFHIMNQSRDTSYSTYNQALTVISQLSLAEVGFIPSLLDT